MGRKPRSCPLCSNHKRDNGWLAEACAECTGEFCLKHIEWDSVDNRWVCSRCARKLAAKREKAKT